MNIDWGLLLFLGVGVVGFCLGFAFALYRLRALVGRLAEPRDYLDLANAAKHEERAARYLFLVDEAVTLLHRDKGAAQGEFAPAWREWLRKIQRGA